MDEVWTFYESFKKYPLIFNELSTLNGETCKWLITQNWEGLN